MPDKELTLTVTGPPEEIHKLSALVSLLWDKRLLNPRELTVQ